MPDSAVLDQLARDVRQLDRDRFATLMFAPPDRRPALLGLYAFNLEVARLRELVHEPMLGRIRLQWWRDSLEAVFQGGSVAHPVLDFLGPVVRRHRLAREPFDRLLDSREWDLEDRPPEDLAALEDYAEGTASTLVALALAVLGAEGEAAGRAARHVGIAWALTGLLRAVPFHAAAGRLYLPADLLAGHGVDPAALLSGKPGPGLPDLARRLAGRARHHLAEARRQRAGVPKAAVPALLCAGLADGYLRRLERNGYDLLDTGWSMPRPRPLRLALGSLTGRF